MEPLIVKPKEACAMLRVGPEKLYKLINSGALQSFKDGGSRKITVESIQAYIRRGLEQQQTAK